ncbi:hypothetical protein AB0M95_34995 [Sphaerisporangium sp. NPDC051017]|uniref:hypothetical protein n=1 Tax=Sphaerisporangium sp. NPDC051017 TaxID=3154636 RepID=UPI003434B62F
MSSGSSHISSSEPATGTTSVHTKITDTAPTPRMSARATTLRGAPVTRWNMRSQERDDQWARTRSQGVLTSATLMSSP